MLGLNENLPVLHSAIYHFGMDNQIIVAIEEMTELTKELTKFQRGIGDVGCIAEEIADTCIMLEQLMIMFGCADDVSAQMQQKLERLKRRIACLE